MAEKKKRKLGNINYVFKNIMWPRKKLLFGGFLLIILSRLAGIALPYAPKYLIDSIITPSRYDLLPMLLLVVGIAVLVQASTSFALTRILSVEAQHLIAELRSKVQQHIIKLPVSYFDNHKTGELVSRIMSDVEGVRNLVGTGFVQLLGGVLTSVLSLIFLLNINAKMTLYVLLPMIVFGVIAVKAFGYIRPIFRKRGELNAQVTGRLTESLGGIRVIKGFDAEEYEIGVFKKGVLELFNNVKRSLTSTSLVTSSSALLLGVATIIIMGVGGNQIAQGAMTVGDFFAFTLYLGFLVTPIVQMGNIGSQLTEAFAGLDRMEEVLETPTEEDGLPRSTSLTSIHGELEFKNVAFYYIEGTPVLHTISFKAKAGTTTALVGTSGSGKSTIAGLAGSFISPVSGQIIIDGHDLQEVSLASYRKHLGVVLQDDFLFEGSIRENILFSRPNATEEELNHAVKHAYIDEFTDRFENGLDTLIGERGVKLSGGQRQRIAIARAILANPRILILDEATSSLDTESESYIQESLEELLKGRTTLVIAHRLSTIRKADQILVVEKGSIVEQGTHDELIAKQGRYYNLYTFQARI
ncbi:MAG: ABC transporter ATP-binding protein [Cyclobacteriaceae bacterium]|nr:ABC transporter ATP-binding protein [Cyclobacteriaceae bacterium]